MAIFTVPVLIGVAAAAAGVTGGKKAYDGYENNERAKRIREESQELLEDEKEKLEKARSQTQDALANLGKAKIEVSGSELKFFKDTFSRIDNPEKLGLREFDPNGDEDLGENFLPPSLEKTVSSSYSILQSGGIQSLSTSALVGAGAYSTVGTFAYASTGTAITTLSGAAAKSATLAWLGGGALSAGGMGVAGGTAVLGGVVAAPALLVGGWIYASKSEQNLSDAKEYKADVLENIQQMRNGRDRLEDIQDFVTRLHDVLGRARRELEKLNTHILNIINEKPEGSRGQGTVDAGYFKGDESKDAYRWVECAIVVFSILNMDIMNESGELVEGINNNLETLNKRIEE